jgi:hypothetical protein
MATQEIRCHFRRPVQTSPRDLEQCFTPHRPNLLPDCPITEAVNKFSDQREFVEEGVKLFRSESAFLWVLKNIIPKQNPHRSFRVIVRQTFCDRPHRTLKRDRFGPIRHESKQTLRIQPMSSEGDFGTGGKREWELGMNNAQI